MKNNDSCVQEMLPRGNNQFNGRFDFFEWSAPYYENPKEVMLALMELPIIDKVVKDIKVIGSVDDPTRTRCSLLGETLLYAGIELEDYWWEKYPHMDSIQVPWEIEACEPFQIVFEDNTTLEILPTESGGARIATNSIPVEIVDGLNRSYFKAEIYYAEIIGKTLKSFEMRVKTTSEYSISQYSVNNKKRYETKHSVYQYCFHFDYPFHITLEQDFPSCYSIKMIGDNGLIYNNSKTTYKRVKESISDINQIYLCSGRGYGGDFWIVPINHDSSVDEKLPFCDGIGMSIDDYCLSYYFQVFLYKYYDSSIQENIEYYPPGEREFDWYDSNLYTFENIRRMIVDIRCAAELLVNDYDNPELDSIKEHFPWNSSSGKKYNEFTKEEINELRKKDVLKIVDLYLRFSDRLEKMMEVPGRDMISFTGP